MELTGYVQPVVAHSGESVQVKVSTTLKEFSAEMIRLGLSEQVIAPQPFKSTYPGQYQDLRSGSYLVADLAEHPLPAAHAAQFWFWPTYPGQRQSLVTGITPAGGWEIGVTETGFCYVAVLSPSGEILRSVSASAQVVAQQWYFAAVSWDEAGGVTIAVSAHDSRSPHTPLSNVAHYEIGAADVTTQVTVGAAVFNQRPSRCFNGKIDTPRLFAGTLSLDELNALAAEAPASRIGSLRHEWLFGPEAALPPHRVRDSGPGHRDATLVNMPTLGVTGRNWAPGTESFVVSPEQYRAAYFHEDDLTDAGWQTDFSFEIPESWPSGVYAVRLRAGSHEDVVPLIVSASRTPARKTRPGTAVLLPTFSWLAYANEHASWVRPIKASIGGAGPMTITEQDHYMNDNRLLSLYDLHPDETGSCLSSWRRPVLNMRPGYLLPLIKGPHQFSADLELLQWLEHRQFEFDVITDDDLHREGLAALRPYRVVLTGSHPEYFSGQMLDGLDGYLASGGRLMYLGGNGFYWVTSAPSDDPYVIEVRRGMAGTRVWEATGGEWNHSMTGERGGLWRHRGRSPQILAGVGFTAQGFDRSLPYTVNEARSDERAAFIVAGLDTSTPLGNRGSVMGGPAGFEIDRADAALGTPAHAVVVASARDFSDSYQGAVEDVMTSDSQQGGSSSELVRSDIVFFETASGGAVFSVGSIAWCGALLAEGEETSIGTMTGNVLSRFLEATPFQLPAEPSGTGG